MTNLSHRASFHSKERIAPSNRGIKHLGYGLRGEGGQLLLAGGGLADGVLDWVAVTLDASAAAWSREGRRLVAAIGALATVLVAGGRRRR